MIVLQALRWFNPELAAFASVVMRDWPRPTRAGKLVWQKITVVTHSLETQSSPQRVHDGAPT
jgi:hypothetical protein